MNLLTKEKLEEILNRYNIKYKYGTKQEVEEGLKLFNDTLLKLKQNPKEKEDTNIHIPLYIQKEEDI